MFKFLAAISLLFVALAQTPPETIKVHGWLSDESCARARAASGTYTATDPECAKRCVAEGKKIVFIDPDARAVFNIANQDAARGNIGDEVEVTGSIDARSNTLNIDSLKLISCGVAVCKRPTSHVR